jgi:tetratricopeptide (TPR) repeat protein
VVRTSGTLRQVPSGFLWVNPLSEDLDRLPTRQFEIRGIASIHTQDRFEVRLPFRGTAALLPREFSEAVGDRQGLAAEEGVSQGIAQGLATWGAARTAAQLLGPDLSAEAQKALADASATLGIQLRALVLEPPDPDLYVLLAEDALARHDPATRLPLIEDGLRRLPNDWRLLTARGLLYEAADSADEAEAVYLQALKANPGAEPAMARMVKALTERGEVFRLETLLLAGIEASPGSAKMHEWLALAYMPTQRYADALHHLEQARTLAPSDPVVLANLGALYQKLERFEDAEAMYRAALAQAPDDPRSHFNLGLIELQRGELEPARRSLERARAGGVDTAQIHNVLAKTYQMLGMKDEATQSLLASYRVDPKQAGLKALLTRLLGHPPEPSR